MTMANVKQIFLYGSCCLTLSVLGGAPLVDGFSIRGGLVGGSEKGPDFWELEFVRGSETFRLDNRAPAKRSCDERDGVSAYLWKGLDLPDAPGAVDVRADVRDIGKGQCEWTIKVANRSSDWALLKTRYPYLRDVAGKGPADFIYPGNLLGARLAKNFRRANRHRRYPSTMVMMTAFLQGGEGLYFAAHDGEGRLKEIHWSQGGDAWFETPVENAGVPGKAAEGPRYPVVTASFKGDWWTAAKIYRAWAVRQKWCAKGPMATRADYPRAMSDAAVWWRLSKSLRPETAADLVTAAWPDVKTGFRFYCWNQEKFDHFYPEFTPREKTPEVVAHAKKLGVTVLPYVNGKIWATNLASYATARAWTLKDREGHERTEWNSGNLFGVICPSVPAWHRKLDGMRKTVIDEVGSNGIYYDQIGIATAGPCYDASHPHPLGGGRWWADGYHAALEPIHAKCAARGYPIATEGFGETLIDVVDGMLICGRREAQDDIPLLPAIYSGYTTFFNSEEDEDDDPRAFFALQSRALLRGVTPGTWQQKGLFNGQLKVQCDIIHTLARIRTAQSEFLAYGELLDELRPLDELPTVTCSYKPTRPHKNARTVTLEFPAVIGYAWRTIDGRKTALFVANVSETDRTVDFRLPEGLRRGARPCALPDQPKATFSVANGDVGRLTLRARAFAMIVSPTVDSPQGK